MPADKVVALWAQGMLFLEHAMQCCRVQHSRNRYFCFEHPEKASSWKQSAVAEVRELPGVMAIKFDQCMVGLKSPIANTNEKAHEADDQLQSLGTMLLRLDVQNESHTLSNQKVKRRK